MPPRRGLELLCIDFYKDCAPNGAGLCEPVVPSGRTPNQAVVSSPTELRHSAQRWSAASALGERAKKNLKELRLGGGEEDVTPSELINLNFLYFADGSLIS